MTEHRCFFCNEPIAPMRVEYLEGEGIHPDNFTCLQHSQARRKLGFFDGTAKDDFEVELGDLIICDSYNATPITPSEKTEEEE